MIFKTLFAQLISNSKYTLSVKIRKCPGYILLMNIITSYITLGLMTVRYVKQPFTMTNLENNDQPCSSPQLNRVFRLCKYMVCVFVFALFFWFSLFSATTAISSKNATYFSHELAGTLDRGKKKEREREREREKGVWFAITRWTQTPNKCACYSVFAAGC